MKKTLILFVLLFLSLATFAKPYKLKIDDFNNQKTYIGNKFADAGSAAGARMFGGQDGKLWSAYIIPGDDFEIEESPELLEKLEIESLSDGFFAIMGEYYTKKINTINDKDSLIIKINKDFHKFDLIYQDRVAEVQSEFGGWRTKFGFMVPKSILLKMIDEKNKSMIRVKGDAKDLTIEVKHKKLKKLSEFIKAVEKDIK